MKYLAAFDKHHQCELWIQELLSHHLPTSQSNTHFPLTGTNEVN